MANTMRTLMGRTAGTVLALATAVAPAAASDAFEKLLREIPRQEGTDEALGAFGLGQQATVIPVLDYMPVSNAVSYSHRPDGYVFGGTQQAVLWTAVPLQHGVNLDSVCFDYQDASAGDLIVGLIVAEAGQQGVMQPELASLAAATTSGSPGYGRACLAPTAAPFPFGIRTFGDATGDGDSATLQYFLIMSIPGDNASALGSITLRWRRTLGPAPSTAQFSDVPTTHPQFRFVEALTFAGITSGCGAGLFCPDAPLTRGQMAVFLSVALGLHWPN